MQRQTAAVGMEIAGWVGRRRREATGDRRQATAWLPVTDRVAGLDTQWHRLAADSGITGEDGAFLIDVAGSWTDRVPRR